MKINHFINNLLDISDNKQWLDLLSAKRHSLPISNHRAETLAKRIKAFALIFCFMVPAWSIIDLFLLPLDLWYKLTALRLISAGIFIAIYYSCKKDDCSLKKIFIELVIFLYTPTLFFLISTFITSSYQLNGISEAILKSYSLLPFIIVASLTIFALTIKEIILLISPLLIITLWSFYPHSTAEISHSLTNIWLFFLLVITSSFSSISQMRFMIMQVSRASFDSLTGAMSRRAGIETLEVHLRMTQLQDSNLSLLFIDLDHFKSVNDTFGHDIGDQILKSAVKSLRSNTRKGDIVVRWGGEEFIVILPQADQSDAQRVLDRIFKEGLGLKPDGTKLTASIGLSEFQNAPAQSWKTLVELADERMYKAKANGRARCIGNNNALIGTFD